MSEWKPIASAPRDGRRIKVLAAEYETDDGDGNVRFVVPPGEFEAWWSGSVWSCERGFFDPHEVTHWMPLPEPLE